MKNAFIFLSVFLLASGVSLSAAISQPASTEVDVIYSQKENSFGIKKDEYDQVKDEYVKISEKELEQLKADLKKEESFIPEPIKNFVYDHRHAIALNALGLAGCGLGKLSGSMNKDNEKALPMIALGGTLAWWTFIIIVDAIKDSVKNTKELFSDSKKASEVK